MDIHQLNPLVLWAASLLLLAGALLVIASGMIRRLLDQSRHRRTVDQVLKTRDPQRIRVQGQPQAKGLAARLRCMADEFGARLSEERWAHALMAPEDRKLVDLAGYDNVPKARVHFVMLRALLALGLPAAAMTLAAFDVLGGDSFAHLAVVVFFCFAAGFMLPKWLVLRRVSSRKRQAGEELPLFIDLLRLLQGVGLSIDQSLQIIVSEFIAILPVLGYELRLAADTHARGRTRAQSLARLATCFDNDDIAAICRLIEQLDRHGGAVQEPLHRFAERVREQRRQDLKEKVGKMTVKMTCVMIVTLLPALLIVTGGAGFLTALRAMSRMAGGG